ncbi:MAG: OmpA family protein [Rhodospirillales bacterium]|nr:MAG: OmpA family protein [Rhodospirillales bacterium]
MGGVDMKWLFTAAVASVVAVGLSACETRPLDEARAMAPTGSEFDRALAENYIALSDVEYRSGDRRDGGAYAMRAQMVRQGQTVLPETVDQRAFITEEEAPDLIAGRSRLMAAFDQGGRNTAPRDAANAQALFDCWQEQTAEGLRPADIAACRDGFFLALEKVEASLMPAAYLVFFDFDRSELTAEGRDIVRAAAASAQDRPFVRIVATGHTDTAGSAQYNLGLSQRRADSVRSYLMTLGIPADRIQTRALGQTQPLVPTGDGVREPQNRRVEIDIQR